MIGFGIYGGEYIGWPVTNSIRKEIYCTKCKESRSFMEMRGRRFLHIWWIPVLPISRKTTWLECPLCDSIVLNYEQKIKEEKDFEEIKKETASYLEEMRYIDVKCPSCKKSGRVKLTEGQFSAEAICRTCGNIYEVRKKTINNPATS